MGSQEAMGSQRGKSHVPCQSLEKHSQKRSWSPSVSFKYALCSDLQSSSRKKSWLRPEDQDEFLIISEDTLIYISLWNKAALSCLCPNDFLKHHTVSAYLGRVCSIRWWSEQWGWISPWADFIRGLELGEMATSDGIYEKALWTSE